jgi:hypothetical protein
MTSAARRWRRAALIYLTAAAAALATVVVPGGPAAASGIALHQSSKTTIRKGLQLWSMSWHNSHGYQHGWVMSVDLTVRGLRIKPGLGFGKLNERQATQDIAARTGAVAGVNGDFFSWSTSVPRGGVGIDGRIVKTPHSERPSQFYIRKDGRAGIGPMSWHGLVSSLSSAGKPIAGHSLFGINTIGATSDGGLTMFTPALANVSVRGCRAVAGTFADGVLTVRRIFPSLTHFGHLPAGERMLVGCGSSGTWVQSHARLGQRLRIQAGLTTPRGMPVTDFISAGRILRLNGQPYNDRTGARTSGINPETALCVSKDQMHVLLISVDGWLSWVNEGNGVTLNELAQLTAALHCYSSVVFDGGGSTTMVKRTAGSLHVVNRVPHWFGQRPVSDALLVFSR